MKSVARKIAISQQNVKFTVTPIFHCTVHTSYTQATYVRKYLNMHVCTLHYMHIIYKHYLIIMQT